MPEERQRQLAYDIQTGGDLSKYSPQEQRATADLRKYFDNWYDRMKAANIDWTRWRIDMKTMLGVCLAMLALPAPASAQQQECFTVAMNNATGGGSLGSVLLNKCTGDTWVFTRTFLMKLWFHRILLSLRTPVFSKAYRRQAFVGLIISSCLWGCHR